MLLAGRTIVRTIWCGRVKLALLRENEQVKLGKLVQIGRNRWENHKETNSRMSNKR